VRITALLISGYEFFLKESRRAPFKKKSYMKSAAPGLLAAHKNWLEKPAGACCHKDSDQMASQNPLSAGITA